MSELYSKHAEFVSKFPERTWSDMLQMPTAMPLAPIRSYLTTNCFRMVPVSF